MKTVNASIRSINSPIEIKRVALNKGNTALDAILLPSERLTNNVETVKKKDDKAIAKIKTLLPFLKFPTNGNIQVNAIICPYGRTSSYGKIIFINGLTPSGNTGVTLSIEKFLLA